MHRADQRHGLDVVRALRVAGHDDPDVLVAGLLHDSAKGKEVGLWQRVGWSLADHYGGGGCRPRHAGSAARFSAGVQNARQPRSGFGGDGLGRGLQRALRRLDSPPGRPDRRRAGHGAAPGRRGELSVTATASPARPRGGEPVPVMITFAAARRAEDATHVRLDVFDGPLALLLSLIEQRQLDVLTVRLGDLAPAFLDALADLETGRLPLLSAFVGVCAQLILIKSRAVLPRPPADDRCAPTAARRPTRKKSCAAGCCCTSSFATPAPAWRHCRLGQDAVPSRSRGGTRRRPSRRTASGPTPARRATAGRRPAHLGTARRAAGAASDRAAPRRDPRAARRPDPPRAAQRADDRAAGAAARRPGSRRGGGDVHGAARDGQGPRDRHRAARAVGTDQRQRSGR